MTNSTSDKNQKISKKSANKVQASSSESLNNFNRFVIVTGDKGGVGKSTFARGLLQIFLDKKLQFTAYDADKRNPQLHRHFGEQRVKLIDIFTRGGGDYLLIDLDEKRPPLALLDLPSQSGEFFEKFDKELDLFESLKSIHYRITMVSVISRVKDSVTIIESLHEYCGKKVDYVVVKNLFHGEEDKFERYNDSEIREKMRKSVSLKEISLPDLFYRPYDYIDEHSLTFSDVFTHEGANIAIKSRVKSWMLAFENSVSLATNLLGLESTPVPIQAPVSESSPTSTPTLVPESISVPTSAPELGAAQTA
ncbi:chromosome partitioning protein ParA [Scytonema hofmannii]|uniref:nucleotide-binding protein n=1 Tax=Scytonema hofmannii TaxID=34078 RepID=UPI00034C5AD7|nr:chromosome partitioning protein ParA [Scytonema hofmannii]